MRIKGWQGGRAGQRSRAGTCFDLRRDGLGTTVTLDEGSVEMASPAVGAQRLDPGRQLGLKERREAVLNPIGPARPVDGRQGGIAFHDLPLSGACAMLSRHGAGPIVIPGAGVADRRISGRLQLDQPQVEPAAPASARNLRHQERVLQGARRLASEGAAVIGMPHNLNLAAAHAHSILLLEGRRIAAEGPPAAVLTEDLIARVDCQPVRVRTHPRRGCPVVLID